MTRANLAAVLGLALALGACFNPSYDHPQCGPEGQCPSGYVCVAGTCEDQAAGIDAPIDSPIDAPIDSPIDSPIDAPLPPIDAAIDASSVDAPNIDAPPAPQCQTVNDIQSPTDPTRCFRRLGSTFPWDVGRMQCQQLPQGDLADIRDPAEQQALTPMFNAGTDLWLGGRDQGFLNYTWVSGFPMNYTHWGAGQPNGPGSCIRARGTGTGGIPGEWWDQTCSQPYLVICVYHAQ